MQIYQLNLNAELLILSRVVIWDSQSNLYNKKVQYRVNFKPRIAFYSKVIHLLHGIILVTPYHVKVANLNDSFHFQTNLLNFESLYQLLELLYFLIDTSLHFLVLINLKIKNY